MMSQIHLLLEWPAQMYLELQKITDFSVIKETIMKEMLPVQVKDSDEDGKIVGTASDFSNFLLPIENMHGSK